MQRDMNHMNDPTQQPSHTAARFIVGLLHVLEASVVVILRHRFGQRYFGGRQAFVPIVVLGFGAFCFPEYDATPLLWLLGLWFLRQLAAQMDLWRRERSGDLEHSYYPGYPRLLRWNWVRRLVSERRAKESIEPVLVLTAGVLLIPIGPPLAAYLMVAAVAMSVNMHMAVMTDRALEMDMRDVRIHQRSMAERLRHGRWGRE